MCRRQFLQFGVNQRNHSIQGFLITVVNALQQLRDLHGRFAAYVIGIKPSKYIVVTVRLDAHGYRRAESTPAFTFESADGSCVIESLPSAGLSISMCAIPRRN